MTKATIEKNPLPKMTRTKHNWASLRKEYFESQHEDVKAFLKQRIGHYDGNTTRQTRGWPASKKKWQQEIADKAIADLKARRGESITDCLDEIILIVKHSVKTMGKNGFAPSEDLKRFWEVLRTEANLPTRIIHSKNENLNFDAGRAKVGILDKIKNFTSQKHGRQKELSGQGDRAESIQPARDSGAAQ